MFSTTARLHRTIDAYFKRIGGWLSAEDLREHHAEWVEPLVTKYRGVDVYGMPANTQGLATLQMLNIIENFDMRGYGFQSPQSLQVQIEAKRLAYEDRARYYADPHFAKIPIDVAQLKGLREGARQADSGWISILAAGASGRGAEPRRYDLLHHGRQRRHDGFDHSVELPRHGFGLGGRRTRFYVSGSRVSCSRCRMAIRISTRRASGRSRPSFPALPRRTASPWISFGVMGGDMQPQGQTQIILNRVDYGLDVQSAADSPRWHHEGSSQSMGEDRAGAGTAAALLRLEAGVPAATRKALDAIWAGRWAPSDGGFGRYECIELRKQGDGSRVRGGQRNAMRCGGAGVLSSRSSYVAARRSALPGVRI